jgi:hypothetical protein
MIRAMKVSPDSAGASALDMWLRAAEPDPVTPGSASSSQGTHAVLAGVSSATTDAAQKPHDTAEDLLVLDIWNGHATGPLSTLHSLVATDATAQQWAEHIFSPLR